VPPLRRRLFRRLFTLAAAASLVLCVAVCLLWARNFWVADSIVLTGEDWMATYNAERNVTRWMWYGDAQPYRLGWVWGTYVTPPITSGIWQELGTSGHVPFSSIGLGFRAERTSRRYGWKTGGRPMYALYVPHWLLALIPAGIVATWLYRARTAHRRRPGHCPTCGYDLRATPARCPECGTIVSGDYLVGESG
jgi:hypothetical protein